MELLTTISDHDKKMTRNPDEKPEGISYFLVNPLGDQKIETPRTRPAQGDMSQLVGTGTVKMLAPHVAQHRTDFVDYVLEHAEPWHRQHLGRLYDLWDQWNHDYFESRMVPSYIMLSEPSNPRRYGDCSSVSGFGGTSQIRIRPSLLTGTYPQ